MRSDLIRLLKTLPHPCGYYKERMAQNLVIDPLATDLPALFNQALTRGFRRAGGHIYRPACSNCRACRPSRVVVDAFTPNRSQRRCARANADLEVAVERADFSAEAFALYRRYLESRHRNGGMDDAGEDDFRWFLLSPWSDTRFLTLRLDGRLIAVAVTDRTPSGLSAVYTFFDPELASRGLGTYCILKQIELAHREGLPHLYLGYWIRGHSKMDYKARFTPLELFDGARWQTSQSAVG